MVYSEAFLIYNAFNRGNWANLLGIQTLPVGGGVQTGVHLHLLHSPGYDYGSNSINNAVPAGCSTHDRDRMIPSIWQLSCPEAISESEADGIWP